MHRRPAPRGKRRPASPSRPPSRTARVRLGAFVLGAGLLAIGCSSPPPPPPEPTLDADAAETRAEASARIERPARIVFDWAASEPGARFSGRGVARVEPAWRVRLDLFLENGETVSRAALVGDDLRLPPGTSEVTLPPPRLLWSAMGLFRPGRGGALMGGRELGDGRVELRYLYPGGEELFYTLAAGRVERVELRRGGEVVEDVRVELASGQLYPTQAVYRHLADFRELRITRESVDTVESYPPDIWEIHG